MPPSRRHQPVSNCGNAHLLGSLRAPHPGGGGGNRRGDGTPHFTYDRRTNIYRYNRGGGLFGKLAKQAVGIEKKLQRKASVQASGLLKRV